jgi:type IV secretory pathway VirB4 component
MQPNQTANPNSTQNSLHVAEVRDGIVIMSDGSFRSVIMAQSINFDLMSPQERESIEFAYQGFLNSLYFPVQIFVRSTKIDMRPYLQKLDHLRVNQENMLLGLLMEDYIDYIAALVQQTNIMDKKFYVVVPYYSTVDISKPVEAGKKVFGGLFELFKLNKSPATEVVTINEQDLEKAKQELKNRVQSVVNGLAQMSVQGIPLNTQELIELYYDVYNPDTATRQSLKNPSELTSPIVQKGNGEAPKSDLGGLY